MVVKPKRGFSPPSRPSSSVISGPVLGITVGVIGALAIILAITAILISYFCNTSAFEDRQQPESDQEGDLIGAPIQPNGVDTLPNYSPAYPPQHFSGFQPQLQQYLQSPQNMPTPTRAIQSSGDLMSISNGKSDEESPSNHP